MYTTTRLETIERRQTDRQTDRAQLQSNLDMLRQTMNRVRTLRSEYRRLISFANENINDAHSLLGDINTLAVRDGRLPIPDEILNEKVAKQQ